MSIRKTYHEFSSEIESYVGFEYVFLSQYKDNKKKIKTRHIRCGFVWDVRPSHLLDGVKKGKIVCPKCNKYIKSTTDDFKEMVRRLVGSEYIVLSEYMGSNDEIKMKHMKCKNMFILKRASHFKQGVRCPHCNNSKGEREVTKFLENKNISFKTQFTFQDCIFTTFLRFDFAIFNDKNLICLIEYDGKQHFEPVDHFGGNEEFQQTQIRDQIKNDYCRDNNIPLLRIPYWEFDNIEEILTGFLLNNNYTIKGEV